MSRKLLFVGRSFMDRAQIAFRIQLAGQPADQFVEIERRAGPKPERRVRGPESCGLPCRRAIRPIAPRSSRPDRAGSSRFPAGRNCARFSVAVRLLRSRGRNRPERALGSAGRKRSRPTDMRLRAKRRGAQVFFSWQYRFRQLVRISGYSVLNRRISSFSSFR